VTNYARMYRFGFTPWERYRTASAASIAALLDREETERSRPLGRALDLGCGRGQYTPGTREEGVGRRGDRLRTGRDRGGSSEGPGSGRAQLRRRRRDAATVVPPGTFDFFLDIGCFQGLDAERRLSQGAGVSALANPGATLLLLSFGPGRWRSLVEGASQEEVETAFAGWEMLAVEPADTAGLGWPMNRTAPQWYRLRRPT
jgi:SAM-dependent methyltransferase